MKKENHALFWVVASALVGVLSFSMLLPLAALKLASVGVSELRIGFFSAIPWVVILATSFLIPVVVQHLGFRNMVVWSAFIGAVVVPIFLVSDNFWLWCAVNMVFGFSVAVRWVLVESWIMQNAPEGQRGRFVGLYETGLGLGFALGPVFLAVTGTEASFPFYLSATLFFISWLFTVFAGPMKTGSTERSPLNAFQGSIGAIDLVLMLASFVGGIHEEGTTSVGAVYGLKLGLSSRVAAQIATLIGTGSFLAQYPIGALSDRLGPRAILNGSLLLLFLLPPLFFFIPFPFLSVGGMGFVWGGIGGGLYTLAMIQVSHLYRDAELVRGTARMIFSYTLGSVIGPLLGGWALQIHPDFGLPVILMILTALCAVFALLQSRRPSL